MMHHDYDEKLMMEIDALRKQLAQKQWDAGQIQQELDTMAAMKAELPKKMDILKVTVILKNSRCLFSKHKLIIV